MACDPHRLRCAANWERRTANRQPLPPETPPARALIDSRTALAMLGVCQKSLTNFVNSGRLLSYQIRPGF